jgi:hypothetical protein
MNPSDPQVCGACSRAALTAPCSRGCKRLALVCGCAEVLALDGVCVVCARASRERVAVDVLVAPSPRVVPGSLREFTRSKRPK